MGKFTKVLAAVLSGAMIVTGTPVTTWNVYAADLDSGSQEVMIQNSEELLATEDTEIVDDLLQVDDEGAQDECLNTRDILLNLDDSDNSSDIGAELADNVDEEDLDNVIEDIDTTDRLVNSMESTSCDAISDNDITASSLLDTEKGILFTSMVCLTFGEEYADCVDYDEEKAKSELGIVPDSVDIICLSNFSKVPEDEVDITYVNNRSCGVAGVIITAKKDSKLYTGATATYFTIKGTEISDTDKVKIDTGAAKVFWNNSSTEDTLPEISVNKINSDNSITPLKPATSYSEDKGWNGDYKIVAVNAKAPGTAVATVVGVGAYTGVKAIKYTILSNDISNGESGIEINCDDSECIYNGKSQHPHINITGPSRTLDYGKDYTVTVKNNKNAYMKKPGDYGFNAKKAPQVTIKGKGLFTGTKTVYFTIKPYELSEASTIVEVPSVKYTGKPVTVKPVVKVRLFNEDGSERIVTLKEKTDYYKLTAGSFDNNIATGNNASVTIKGKDGSNYTGNVTANFTIANNSISAKKAFVFGTIGNREFTGEPIELTQEEIDKLVMVAVNGKAPANPLDAVYLKCGEDYRLSYSNNTNAGKATVTITGIGQYYGSKKLTFKITPRENLNIKSYFEFLDGEKNIDIKENKGIYDSSETVPYTGYAIKPSSFRLYDNITGYTLVEKKDYTLKYSNNTNVSSKSPAKVTITFKGNYSGKAAVIYKITGWDISDNLIYWLGDTLYFTSEKPDILCNKGKAIKPDMTFENRNTYQVINKKALKISYSNNKKVSTGSPAVITISPKNKNLTGVVQIKFNILAIDISNATISNISTQKINLNLKDIKAILKSGFGKVEPKITVTYNNKKLKQGVDYTIEYMNNTNIGVGKVVVTGIGYYTGTLEKEFIII